MRVGGVRVDVVRVGGWECVRVGVCEGGRV